MICVPAVGHQGATDFRRGHSGGKKGRLSLGACPRGSFDRDAARRRRSRSCSSRGGGVLRDHHLTRALRRRCRTVDDGRCAGRALLGCRRGCEAPGALVARGREPAGSLGGRCGGCRDRLGRGVRLGRRRAARAGHAAHALPHRQRLDTADIGCRRSASRARAHRPRCPGPAVRARVPRETMAGQHGAGDGPRGRHPTRRSASNPSRTKSTRLSSVVVASSTTSGHSRANCAIFGARIIRAARRDATTRTRPAGWALRPAM